MKTLLWLDDCRDPFEKNSNWLIFSPIGKEVDVTWVTTYQEFIDYIMINELPDAICFDHDLGDEDKTGMDCTKWLTEYCFHNHKLLPAYNSQSSNPVGRENILTYLDNFKKYIQL